MRNLLALFAAALLTVVGVGWYLGWYKVGSQPASVPGQHRVNIDIDTNKIDTDLHKGEERLHQMLENRGGQTATKPAQGLTLPSAPSTKPSSDSTPLFQFHSGSGGPTLDIGSDMKHPLIQIGGSDPK